MFIGSEDLEKVDMFRGINELARIFLAEHMKRVKYPKGHVVMRKGEAPGNCCFILDGICHVRNNEPSLDKEGNPSTGTIERHQGFRGIGDSIGITSALAQYANYSQESMQLKERRMIARAKYEAFLKVGCNTANTHAVTDCEMLICDRDTLLTAVQICPYLVANIARAISLRMQQDALLQQRAALSPPECLPLVAQFFYEWHMALAAYRDNGTGKHYDAPLFRHGQLKQWLRIDDDVIFANAIRFLCLDAAIVNKLMAVKKVSPSEAATYQALSKDEKSLVDADALLRWCQEDQSRKLLSREHTSKPKKKDEASEQNPVR